MGTRVSDQSLIPLVMCSIFDLEELCDRPISVTSTKLDIIAVSWSLSYGKMSKTRMKRCWKTSRDFPTMLRVVSFEMVWIAQLTWEQGLGRGTLDLLRPYLFRLSDRGKLNELHPRILQVLDPSPDDHSLTIDILPCLSNLSAEVRQRFRKSLSRHLFGYDALESLRIRLVLADFIWVGIQCMDQAARFIFDPRNTLIPGVNAIVVGLLPNISSMRFRIGSYAPSYAISMLSFPF